MLLNCNNKKISSDKDKTTDAFRLNKISGMDQITYHPFRFKKYRLGVDKNDYCAFPICRPGFEPEFLSEKILTGKRLLVNLCNLAHQINCYDNNIPYDRLIIKWCLENMHPYSVDFIYSELYENFDINTFDAEIVEKDGIFEINEFMRDLGKLYNAVMYYIALEDICTGNDENVYDLSKEGKFFGRYSFFKKHQYSKVEIKRENRAIVFRPAADTPISKKTITLHDNYETLRDTLIDIIPEFNMKLKVDPCSGTIDFSIDVESVFDIAWFTLAKMISGNPASEDKGKPDPHVEAIMIRCCNCGRFMIKKSNQQRFCDSDKCQKARNARKQKAYRDRKASEKAHKK